MWEECDVGNVIVGNWQREKMWNLKMALCCAEFLFGILNYLILLSYVKTGVSILLVWAGSGTNYTDTSHLLSKFCAFIIDISNYLPFPAIFRLIFIILILPSTPVFVYQFKNKSLHLCPTQLGYILFRKMTTCFGLRDCHQSIITKILKIRCSAVQIKLMIWDPVWPTKFI